MQHAYFFKKTVLIHAVVLACCGLFAASSLFADERNGLDLLVKAYGMVQTEKEAGVDELFAKDWLQPQGLTTTELARLQAWLDANQEALPIFDQAIQTTPWVFPVMDPTTLEPMSDWQRIRALARLKMVQARLALARGDLAQGVASLRAVVTLGERLRTGEQGYLIPMVIGISLQQKALNCLVSLCVDYAPDQAVLEQVLNVLAQQEQPDTQFIQGIGGEWESFTLPLTERVGRDIQLILAQLELEPQAIFNTDETRALLASKFAFLQENARRPWPERKTWPSEQWQAAAADFAPLAKKLMEEPELEPEREESYYDEIFPSLPIKGFDLQDAAHVRQWQELAKVAQGEHNILGRYLAFVEDSDFQPYYQRSVLVRTEINRVRTLAAIQLFRLRRGNAPRQLADLVADKILVALPSDLFADGPFHYAADKGLLWSVGPDGEDNGGDGERDLVLALHGAP